MANSCQRVLLSLAILAAIPRSSLSQSSLTLQDRQAVSTVSFVDLSQVLTTRAGALLVLDRAGGYLTWLSSHLDRSHVVLSRDGDRSSEFVWPSGPFGLARWLGDSTLIINHASPIVIDSAGVPRGFRSLRSQMAAAQSTSLGQPTFVTADGDLIYRAMPIVSAQRNIGMPLSSRDSIPILRSSTQRKRVDTIAWVDAPRIVSGINQVGDTVDYVDPFFTLDAWTVTSSGTVVVLRPYQYRVDLYRDGVKRSNQVQVPKGGLSTGLKRLIVDSLQRERNRRTLTVNASPRGGRIRSREVAPARILPDTAPWFLNSPAILDSKENVWLMRFSVGASPVPICEVISFDGEMRRRVILPEGRRILALTDSSIYLGVKTDHGFVLERYPRPQ